MDAINKTPAGPGAICEPEGLPLDEHVKAAWESSGIADGASLAVALSVLPALPSKSVPLKKANAAMRTEAVAPQASVDTKKQITPETKTAARTTAEAVEIAAESAPKMAVKTEEISAPKPAAIEAKVDSKAAAQTAPKTAATTEPKIAAKPEASAAKTTSTAIDAAPLPALRTVRDKKLRPDDSAALIVTPQPAPIPAAMPDLAWQPQHGAVTNDKPRQQPPASIPAAPSDTADAAPRREAAPILAALTPNAAAPTGAKFTPATMGDLPRAANAARPPAPVASQNMLAGTTPQTPKTIDAPAPAMRADAAANQAPSFPNKSAGKQAQRADSPTEARSVQASETKSASPAAISSAQSPEDVEADFSLQAGLPADADQTAETMPFMMPAAVARKQKSGAQAADSTQQSQQSALPAQAMPPSALAAGEEAPQPRPAKQKTQTAAMANAANAAKTDKAANVGASAGASLTYRFDKWNGNHAVTVQTATPAELPQAASEHAPAQGQAWTPAGQLPNAAQAAQYTLSPSDQLVGQRLQEHLAQFGRDAHLPSVHLRDTDEHERQRQQHQPQPQEDDEEEA